MKNFFKTCSIFVLLIFSVYISKTQSICETPTNLMISDIGPYQVDIDFNANGSRDYEISHSGDYYSQMGNTGSANNIYVAHRFATTDLTSYNGFSLTKVSFVPVNADCNYTITVWRGGNANGPSTIIHEQPLLTSTLSLLSWNEIVLTTPIPLSISQELWIGIKCVSSQPGMAIGCDAGPRSSGKGNMIHANNRWYQLTDLNSNLDINFCIKGHLNKENYNLEYGLHGFDIGNGTTVQASYQQIDTSTTRINYYGLRANTTYDAYIQKDCGGGVLSDWAGPITFTTPADLDWCTETFESYTIGQRVAAQANANGNTCWTTWSNNPGSSEDGLVTNELVFQGEKAAKLTYGNDLVLLLRDKTLGNFIVEYSIYIPTGKDAYSNILHVFAGANSEWANELYFNQNNSTPGRGYLKVIGQNTTFTFPHDQWFPVKFNVDLYNDVITLTVNHNVVKTWQFSLVSSTNTIGVKQLAAIGFYPPTNSTRSLFYIDNVNIAYLGSSENPLTINNAQDLIDLRNAVNQNGMYKNVPATSGTMTGFENSYFVVTADIDLSAVCGEDINGQEINWTPIGISTRPFKGKVNGQHHIIQHLYHNSFQNDVGLFGVVDGAHIDSLHFEGGNINGGNNVGSLCGTAKNSASFTAITNGIKISGTENVGGIIGSMLQSTTISQSANTGSIAATSKIAGGIVGKIENSSIAYAINSGCISGPSKNGGIIGAIAGNSSSIYNVLNSGMVLGNHSQIGGIVGEILNSPTINNAFYDKQIVPMAIGNGKLTNEILGTNLQGYIGNDSLWVFSPLLYPRIASISSRNVSLLAATPLSINPMENIDTIIHTMSIELGNGVNWYSLDSSIITISHNLATLNCLDSLSHTSLIAELNDIEKEYLIVNHKISYYTADTLRLCQNQLPYLYQDSLIITGPIDTTTVFTTTFGCDSIRSLIVFINPNPQVSIVGNTTPCFGENIDLHAISDTPDDHFNWSTGDTTALLTILNVTNNMHISLQTSRKFDYITCYSHDSVQIMYNPIYNHTDSIGICYTQLPYEYENTGIFFTDSGWQNPIVLQSEKRCDSTIHVFLRIYYDNNYYDTVAICENQLPYTYGDTLFLEETVSGDYIFTSTNFTGCNDLINLHLIIVELPKVSIVGNLTPCFGDNTLLLARSDRQTDRFLWGTGETSALLTIPNVTSNVIASVQALREYAPITCYGYDTVEISYNPIYNHDDSICICYSFLPYEYGNTGVFLTDSGWQQPITLQSVSGCDSVINVYLSIAYDTFENDTLTICQNDLPLQYGDSVFSSTTTTGDYTIVFVSSTGCDSVIYLHLVVNPIPTINGLTGDDRIFLHDTVALSVSTSDYFQWSTGDTTHNIVVVPSVPGDNDYKVYLSNDFGCMDTAIFTIRVETCDAGYPAYDFEQNSYQTKFYGRVCWMIENLRSTRFADGEPIPQTLSYYSSVYPDSLYNVSVFGKLYNWYTATRYGNEIHYDSPDLQNQGVCPEGWRLPTHAEFMVFMNTYNYTLADLKSQHYWLDGTGNNSSGFTWLPAGYFNDNINQFMNLYGNGYFITLTSVSTTQFESFSCGYNCPEMQREVANKMNGYSVRCIKTVDN